MGEEEGAVEVAVVGMTGPAHPFPATQKLQVCLPLALGAPRPTLVASPANTWQLYYSFLSAGATLTHGPAFPCSRTGQTRTAHHPHGKQTT